VTSLVGKVAFVTGATSGIGRATAVAFGQRGATVIVAGRRELEGQKTAALVEDAGGRGRFIRTDVSIEAEVAAAIGTAVAQYGRLDFAANCAGVDPTGPLIDLTEADYEAAFGTNVKGLFFCLKHEIRAMQASGGAIVNVGSISAEKSVAENSLYDASKGAVRRLTRTAALEAARYGIRINEVAPGAVDTPMLQGFLRKSEASGGRFTTESIAAALPIGRMGRPEDIAEVILFACSPRASFMTGAVITVDGGLLMS
jgi:NAD(P)-dependent dehydrogenase (short-subunit alcohol dehydrogenase family)